jgi:hypothetical protein
MKLKSHIWLVILLGLVAFGQPVKADVNGSIWGTVRDASGAVVPNASVLLHNVSTGLKRQVSTQPTGEYEFLEVPVGSGYVLEVEASGFQKFVQSDMNLLVNQRFRVDVNLVVGTAAQHITVSAAPAQVEASSTQLGDVIEDRKMVGLPLNGRSFIDLMGLQAGVVPITSGVANTDRPISGELDSGAFSVNGSRETGNAFLVNGGDVEESKNNGATISPNLDSIQEFRVLTNSFDAEYGRFAGGVVNVVTKSGTNDLHGTLYDFLRNKQLDARNFFDTNQTSIVTGQEIPNSARGEFTRNQFGGVVGGPILKNRLFFFTDYEGTREIVGLTQTAVGLPTQAERTGDFSDTAAAGFPALTGIVKGKNIPGGHTLSDVLSARLGYTVNAGEPFWTPGCTTMQAAAAGTCVFPNQVIPQSAWGPVAKATLKFIAAPTGSINGTPYFSSSSEKQNLRDDKFGERITLNTKRTGDWSFYYHFDDDSLLNPYPNANLPGFPGATASRAMVMNASNTYIFGPTAVNELRLNYTRFSTHPGTPSGPGVAPLSSFGFVEGGLGIIPSNPKVVGMPTMGVGNGYGFTIGIPYSQDSQTNDTYQLTDNFSKLTGKHSLKFGLDIRNIQLNFHSSPDTNGDFSFSGGETANSFADYLLGTPDGYAQGSVATLYSRSNYVGVFAQDSFKLKPNFTVNAGLRWDVTQPFWEKNNELNVINWGQNSTVFPGAPTGWVFPGDPGISKTIAPTRYNNFAPRLGLAYSPGFHDGAMGKVFGGPGKTSIRAAFGLYYIAVEDQPGSWTIADAPFGNFFSDGNTYLEEPFKDVLIDNDPGQRFPVSAPRPGQKLDWSKFLPIHGSPVVALNNVTPMVMHWNFTIQRELPKSIILTTGYVGTRGRHLLAAEESNIASPARCLQIAQILDAQGRAGEACGPYGEDRIYDLNGDGQYTLGVDAFGTRNHSITSGYYASQGILDFSTGDNYNANMASSDYDAFETSVEKKVGALQLLAAYTWSKSLDDSSNYLDNYINPVDSRVSKALSAFDLTHNFVVSYTYALPFQRNTHGAMAKLLGGWQLSGITHFSTGLPIWLHEWDDRSLRGDYIDTPNYNGMPIRYMNPRDTAGHQYFSKTPFSPESLGFYGTANSRFFHGPGLNNWDLLLRKNTRISERFSTEVRIEFFNIVNHAQFVVAPYTGIGDPTFGDVNSANAPRIGQVALKFFF